MLLEIATGSETFRTKVALKWFVTGVNALVHHQIWLICEYFPANFKHFTLFQIFIIVTFNRVVNDFAFCFLFPLLFFIAYTLFHFFSIIYICANKAVSVRNKKKFSKILKNDLLLKEGKHGKELTLFLSNDSISDIA